MKIYKIIGFSLILSSILLITGCSNNKQHTESNSSQQHMSKLEIEIYKAVQNTLDSDPYNPSNGLIPKWLYEDYMKEYTKNINLLSVKIEKNHIKILFDNTLLPEQGSIEDITKPLYESAEEVVEKHNLKNMDITIYANGEEARV